MSHHIISPTSDETGSYSAEYKVEGVRAGQCFGLVPEGESGRKVFQGPLIAGPWSFSFGCATVIDGRAKAPRPTIALGDTVQIIGDPQVYRVEQSRYGGCVNPDQTSLVPVEN